MHRKYHISHNGNLFLRTRYFDGRKPVDVLLLDTRGLGDRRARKKAAVAEVARLCGHELGEVMFSHRIDVSSVGVIRNVGTREIPVSITITV